MARRLQDVFEFKYAQMPDESSGSEVELEPEPQLEAEQESSDSDSDSDSSHDSEEDRANKLAQLHKKVYVIVLLMHCLQQQVLLLI